MFSSILKTAPVVIFFAVMALAMPRHECYEEEDCLPGQICTMALGRNVCYDFPLFMQGRRKRSAEWCQSDSECNVGYACHNKFCEPSNK